MFLSSYFWKRGFFVCASGKEVLSAQLSKRGSFSLSLGVFALLHSAAPSQVELQSFLELFGPTAETSRLLVVPEDGPENVVACLEERIELCLRHRERAQREKARQEAEALEREKEEEQKRALLEEEEAEKRKEAAERRKKAAEEGLEIEEDGETDERRKTVFLGL